MAREEIGAMLFHVFVSFMWFLPWGIMKSQIIWLFIERYFVNNTEHISVKHNRFR